MAIEASEESVEGSTMTLEEAKKLATELLIKEVPREEIMEQTGLSREVVNGLKGALKKKLKKLRVSERAATDVEEKIEPIEASTDVEEEEIFIPSPEEQMYAEMATVLEGALSGTPGIKPFNAKYIVRAFKGNPRHKEDPQSLHFLIQQSCPSAKNFTIGEVVTPVFRVKEKYPQLMGGSHGTMPYYDFQRRSQGFVSPVMGYGQPPMSVPYNPYASGPYPPTMNPGFGFSNETQVQKRIVDAIKEEREKTHLDALQKTIEKLSESIIELKKGGEKKAEAQVTRRKYDEEGHITDEYIGPASAVKESEVEKMLQYKSFFTSDITPEKIRQIVKETVPQGPSKDPEVAKLEVKLEETTKAIGDLRESVSEKDRKRLEDQIIKLDNKLDALRVDRKVDAYQDDTMRLIADVGGRLADKNFGKEVLTTVKELARPSSSPVEKLVERDSTEGLLNRLDEEFVATE